VTVTRPVRIGILGAARIAPAAVINPARLSPEAQVVAVAARDPQRAATFASEHGIPRVHPDYQALVEDPDIDAVYNPLPNGLHAQWTIAALRAGKHVLCEKPFTANAEEAGEVAAVADTTGLVVMEAFHYRYHPVAERMLEVVSDGTLGTLRHVEVWIAFPLLHFSDIRYDFDLAGGSMMDAGCYAVSIARLLGRQEPEVLDARATLHGDQIDRAMHVQLRFPSGHTATLRASMWTPTMPLRIAARATGDRGQLRVLNPLAPQAGYRLAIRAGGKRRSEWGRGRPTYEYQLDAFCAAILHDGPVLTPPSYSLANMRVIDSVYRAAGLRPRGT
jgi:predicted dehydrogenase